MPRIKEDLPTPACYALVIPGLESVCAEEISRELRGQVKKKGPGFVVFRAELDRRLLSLRTTEDVFLLAWGTDELSHRAADLESIRRWTAFDVKWDNLLRVHHAIRPKPKGKPTYHLVTQMVGKHVYRRVDALKAMARGLEGVIPSSWRNAEENASVEVWLTIVGSAAICGLRLSDRTMRHRLYKREHVPASLRPTVAAAMVYLSDIRSGQRIVDPMCGAGTILAETLEYAGAHRLAELVVEGIDVDSSAVRKAQINLSKLGDSSLQVGDALRLPQGPESVDRIISNPPFGKQLSRPEQIQKLYAKMILEYDRVLKSGGRATLLVSEFSLLKEAASQVGWKLAKTLKLRVLGQAATLSVWQKLDAKCSKD